MDLVVSRSEQHGIGGCARNHAGQGGKVTVLPRVIGIKEGDVIGFRRADRQIARRVSSRPRRLPLQNLYSGIAACDLWTIVRGRIVDNDDLGRSDRLALHGVKGAGDMPALVVQWNDDTNRRHTKIPFLNKITVKRTA